MVTSTKSQVNLHILEPQGDVAEVMLLYFTEDIQCWYKQGPENSLHWKQLNSSNVFLSFSFTSYVNIVEQEMPKIQLKSAVE